MGIQNFECDECGKKTDEAAILELTARHTLEEPLSSDLYLENKHFCTNDCLLKYVNRDWDDGPVFLREIT